MAKYSFEFKKKVVQEYLNGEGGVTYLSKKHNISQTTSSHVQKWIKAYQEFGDDGLKRIRKNNSYSFEFKLHVVELYLRNEVSYQELALSQGMNNWRNGMLMGSSPEEAFYVRCGKNTMSQDDILNGRLICEIGVAPMRPAEFVTFRITQKIQERE